MKTTVIGKGPLSLSVAAQIAIKGDETFYVDLSVKEKSSEDFTLTLTGAMDAAVNFKRVTGDYSSVADSEFIFVTVGASQHREVADNILPLLKDGQTVVFFPACFGALSFKKELMGRGLAVNVAESVSFLCIAAQNGDNGILIQGVKSSMKVAVRPRENEEVVFSKLQKWFDGLVLGNNFVETSLDNINIVLHPLPLLLNIGGVEKGESEFHHFTDGVTKTVGRLMEKMDEERMAIGKAIGVGLTDALQVLKEYYGDRGLETLTDYVSSPKGPYPKVKGFGLNSRYITEDVPYLLVAASSIAKLYSVETPIIDLTIKLAELALDCDYEKIGYYFNDRSDLE